MARIEFVSSDEILSAMDTLVPKLFAMGSSQALTGAGFVALLKQVSPAVAAAMQSQIWMGTAPQGQQGSITPSELAIFIQRYVNERIEHGDFRDFQGYYSQKLLPTLVGLFQASQDLQRPLVFSRLKNNTLSAELIEPHEVQFSTSSFYPALPTNVTASQSLKQPSYKWDNTITFSNSSTTASAYLSTAYIQKYMTFSTKLAAGTIYSSQPLFQDSTAFVVNGVFDNGGKMEAMYFQDTTDEMLSVHKPLYDITYYANGNVFRNFDPQASFYIGKNAEGYVTVKTPISTTIAESGTTTLDLDLRADGVFIATSDIFASLTDQF